MKKEIKEEAVVVDYKKVLVELFEKVELSQPRTLVLTARPDDGTGLKPVTHLKEQASLALGSLFGRTVYDVNVWMCPKERTLFKRTIVLDTYVTAAFGSVTIAKRAYQDLKSLFAK